MITLNTNVTNLITKRSLCSANNSIKTCVERLSTGYKINKAADDAANLAISNKMQSQSLGIEKAQENVSQAQGFLSIADGTLDNMTQISHRIRELSLRSMNGIYTDEERGLIQTEVGQLTQELYRQKNNAKYGEISIFGNSSTQEETPQPGSVPVEQLTESEAIEQGYSLIKSVDDFLNLNGTASGKYILMNDLDMSGVDYESSHTNIILTGEFNGNGHTISNFSLNSSRFQSGLFGIVPGGSIKNLTLQNCSLSGAVSQSGILCGVAYNATIENCAIRDANIETTGYNVGGLCGTFSGGSITNCYVTGNIKSTNYQIGGLSASLSGCIIKNCYTDCNVNATREVGGFYASASGATIQNCYSQGTVKASGNNAGGFAGTGSATITDCYSNVKTVEGKDNVGGFIGYDQGSTLTNCHATGNVTATGMTSGGLCGWSSGNKTNCYATGNVTGTQQAGGLFGWIGGTVTNCFATGDVTASGNLAGGLVGDSYASITNSYATGNVTGAGSVGGFAGAQGSPVSNCYSTGNVTGSSTNVGGFAGELRNSNMANIENCYSEGKVNGSGSNYGMFYGTSSATINNCYANNEQSADVSTEQSDVEGQDEGWFRSPSNLNFLGSAYTFRGLHPELVSNFENSSGYMLLQVGANSGKDNMLEFDLGFDIKYNFDVSTTSNATFTLNNVDKLLSTLSERRAACGIVQNKLDSITNSLSARFENINASLSTIRDTDFAVETSKLIRNQILQQASASLMTTSNTLYSMALNLLQ